MTVLGVFAGRVALKWLAYALGALLVAAVIGWAWQTWKARGLALRVAEARVEAAEGEVRRAEAELELNRRNTAIAGELVAEDLLELRELAPKYQDLERRIAEHEDRPVPMPCRGLMLPFADAVDGVLRIEGRDGDGTGSAAGRAPHPDRRADAAHEGRAPRPER